MRKITTKPATATSNKATAKPVVKPVAAKPATVATAKPATAKPVAAPASNVPAVAKPVRGVNRTAATIAANLYPFGARSERDDAYLAFYAQHAKRNGGKLNLATIAANAGTHRPDALSNKPHDAGVIIRLQKAKLLTALGADGSFDFTPEARTLAVVSSNLK